MSMQSTYADDTILKAQSQEEQKNLLGEKKKKPLDEGERGEW